MKKNMGSTSIRVRREEDEEGGPDQILRAYARPSDRFLHSASCLLFTICRADDQAPTHVYDPLSLFLHGYTDRNTSCRRRPPPQELF